MKKYLETPYRQYILIIVLFCALAIFYATHGFGYQVLFIVAFLGSLDTAWSAVRSVYRREIGIDTFNIFAIIVAFIAGSVTSAAFIVLMLSFAGLLEWRVASRSGDAIKALLALKPHTATRENKDGSLEEIEVSAVKKNDILIVKNGSGIPTDGVVLSGRGEVNESAITGESRLTAKIEGDEVLGGTIFSAGFLKMRATRVGEESTIEQMIALVKKAAKNKSKSERLADRFAGLFLPVVLLLGAGTYFFTHNLIMAGSIFLVACADDMAVAIPLAVAAAIGRAARSGVIVKGGEWLDTLARVRVIVLDKTGTLTYGSVAVKNVVIEDGVVEKKFWNALSAAEKFSVHPAGKALFREAVLRGSDTSDPDDYKNIEGKGVRVRKVGEDIFVGNMSIVLDHDVPLSDKMRQAYEDAGERGEAPFFVIANEFVLGVVSVADVVRIEAKESMRKLKELGIEVVMLTGDNKVIAKETADALGIEHFRASLKPEDKLREIESLLLRGPVVMVGDGINDAPSLSRADVGIAMGGEGTAVAVEAADIVILTDNLSRLPEMIELGRATRRVVNIDMILWVVSNVIGFYLVLSGVMGLAFAAFYNFVTDFIPLANSAAFFRGHRTKKGE